MRFLVRSDKKSKRLVVFQPMRAVARSEVQERGNRKLLKDEYLAKK